VYCPDKQSFAAKAHPGCVIPVHREIVADLLTPLSAFLRLDLDPDQAAYLLESVEGGEKWGRYSFIGVQPRRIIRSQGNVLDVSHGGDWTSQTVDNALSSICAMATQSTPIIDEELPRFWGGLVGYLGYDMVRSIESLPNHAKRDPSIWDSYLMEASVVVILDSLRQRARIVCPVHVGDDPNIDALWDETTTTLDTMAARLTTPVSAPAAPALSAEAPLTEPSANMQSEEFCNAVERAREYIQSGDIIQVVLSRRFEIPSQGIDPFSIYRALRLTNPSPYLFFIRYPEYAVVGASPELLVRREDETVEVRPIAGTRRRGGSPQEDRAIEEELRTDPKEIAEHVMLLDLGRNDVGRISQMGTVKVPERMVVERYSHVMHLVSSVRGTLLPNTDMEHVIRATFPAGTLSGAPKVRAMEIIEELEPHGRGVYGGAAGYLGYDGNLDLAIAIRSLIALPELLHVQVGAGIVYDSVPTRELEETREKAMAVLRAIQLAQGEHSP